MKKWTGGVRGGRPGNRPGVARQGVLCSPGLLSGDSFKAGSPFNSQPGAPAVFLLNPLWVFRPEFHVFSLREFLSEGC